jgi:hypothetical protein
MQQVSLPLCLLLQLNLHIFCDDIKESRLLDVEVLIFELLIPLLSWALDKDRWRKVCWVHFRVKRVQLIIKEESTGVHHPSGQWHSDLGLKISVRVIVALPNTPSSDNFYVREPAHILE